VRAPNFLFRRRTLVDVPRLALVNVEARVRWLVDRHCHELERLVDAEESD
jgi:hypothetical protein